MTTLTLGQRAAFELALADAERDLKAVIEEHNSLMAQADVLSAQACEPGRNAPRYNLAAATQRFRAFAMRGDIEEARGRVETLKTKLNPAPAVVLTNEQCAAVDDTHNFAGVAA